MAAWSKAWVCGRSLAGMAGSNPAGSMDVFRVIVVCCQVEGLRRTHHSSRGVLPSMVCLIEYDREASIKRRFWPARGFCFMEKSRSEITLFSRQ